MRHTQKWREDYTPTIDKTLTDSKSKVSLCKEPTRIRDRPDDTTNKCREEHLGVYLRSQTFHRTVYQKGKS